MLYKVVWQHMQGVVGLLITTELQIYPKKSSGILKKNQLRFDRIMAISLCPRFLAHPIRALLLPIKFNMAAGANLNFR